MTGRKFSRRDFLKGSAVFGGSLLIPRLPRHFLSGTFSLQTGQKRIYLAPDDHTDYFWTAGETAYRDSFIRMIDYYLNLADTTQTNVPEHQSRWNCDGSIWLWTYEKNKTKAEYDRLISRVKSGHISFPLNALVVCLGGVPAEAVLRGMYYPGKIERREGVRFRMAVSMENQTLPLGLVSLWAGAGARFSWKGICGCDTQVTAAGNREFDIYWWTGLDGSKVLMKWNSMLQGNQYPGGYAEARFPSSSVDYVDSDLAFRAKYPYPIIGVFGKGWDDLETLTNEFVTVAQSKTNSTRKVIVSNEEDFFDDFEANYGTGLPAQTVSFGNEWDLYCAGLAETSASVKRSLEKLRGAEAIATLVTLENPSFMNGRQDARDQAWMNLGLFWEHNFGMVGKPGAIDQRVAWQKRLDNEIRTYVDTLRSDAVTALGGMIKSSGANKRFFAFNPLSWTRSDYVDYPVNNTNPVHVIDLTTGQETPSQFVTIGGSTYLRILADGIPAVGYKVFEIQPGSGQVYSDAATVTGSIIENQYYQITLSTNGAITSWVDKMRGNRQFVRVINGRTINDLGSGTGTLQVENVGPVTVTLLATGNGPLAHTTRITLIRNSDRVEIQNDINQNFGSTNTWGFGFELTNPDVWHEEVGAVIRARLTTQGGHYSPRSNNSRYDWLTLNHFADMSDGSVGVTLSNADCYFMRLGNSTKSSLDVSTPQISVLAGGGVVGAGWGGLPNQGGDTHFLQRFALTTHDAFVQRTAMQFSLEHQNPLIAGNVNGGSVYPETSFSLLSIDDPDVLLWALKPSDDKPNNDVVLRVWNVSQTGGNFSLGLNWSGIVGAQKLTHIETPLGSASLANSNLVDSISPAQMKTYAVSRQTMQPVVPPVPTVPPYLKSEIIPPISSDTQSGQVVGSLDTLSFLQQSGSNDDPGTYVVFSPSGANYLGVLSFYLPDTLHRSNISNILVQINYKDPAPSQKWTWSVYSWGFKKWVLLGDAAGGDSQWKTLLFRIDHPQQYISRTNEIRIQLSSKNASGSIKIDYEALHLTYKSFDPGTPPVAPGVPGRRPGIASAPRITHQVPPPSTQTS